MRQKIGIGLQLKALCPARCVHGGITGSAHVLEHASRLRHARSASGIGAAESAFGIGAAGSAFGIGALTKKVEYTATSVAQWPVNSSTTSCRSGRLLQQEIIKTQPKNYKRPLSPV